MNDVIRPFSAGTTLPGKTREILDLAAELIRIPSVTVGGEIRLDEVGHGGTRSDAGQAVDGGSS